MVVLDLEWNSGRYGGKLNEILQIGAVRLDHLGGQILDTFCAYVHPTVHRSYSPAAASLPELSLARSSSVDFPSAMTAFAEWCDGETEYACWGVSDFQVLRENIRYYGLDAGVPDHFYDLQYAFTQAAGSLNSPALEPAVAYCQIPETFEFHNALYDSLYTALVGGCLKPEEVKPALRELQEIGRRNRRLTRLGLPRKKEGTWLGPYVSRERALNSRGCRRGDCPRCGTSQRAVDWATEDSVFYYSMLKCPVHGPYLLRLELAADHQKRVWGYTEVGEPTRENLAALEQARQTCSGSCKNFPQPKTRRRRRRGRRGRRQRRPPSATAGQT